MIPHIKQFTNINEENLNDTKTHLGVINCSTRINGGVSALNGFTEAACRAVCLRGSLLYGSDMSLVKSCDSSLDKLP
jgi:hypothetical protein